MKGSVTDTGPDTAQLRAQLDTLTVERPSGYLRSEGGRGLVRAIARRRKVLVAAADHGIEVVVGPELLTTANGRLRTALAAAPHG